jgi:hypothetical protein
MIDALTEGKGDSFSTHPDSGWVCPPQAHTDSLQSLPFAPLLAAAFKSRAGRGRDAECG